MSRCFVNRLPPYPELGTPAASTEAGVQETLESLKTCWDRITTRPSAHDASAYTGVAGVAYTAWHVARNAALTRPVLPEGEALGTGMRLAAAAVREEERHAPRPSRDLSFLAGRAGVHCIAALCTGAAARLAEAQGANAAAALRSEERRLASAYAELAPVAEAAEAGPQEFIYGRSGYLFGALLLNSQLGWMAVPVRRVHGIAESIVRAGRALAAATPGCRSPLWYEWHDSPYLGAAHGLAGILHVLLHVPHAVAAHESPIRGALDFVLSLECDAHGTPGRHGHWPSSMSLRREKEALVHWCHGAPGMCLVLCKAYQVFGDKKLLEAALRAGQTVWERGLLKKGPGACHGVAGNAYALLRLHRTTGDPAWLHRARQFARFMSSGEFRAGALTPDHPYSLFEGEAAACCLLTDLLRPERAAFPLFELDL